MTVPHIFLAILCTVLWGGCVIANKLGTTDLPPLFFAGLRFWVLAPLLLVIPRPQIPWGELLKYSTICGFLMTSLLALGLSLGTSAGVGAILMQSSSFFAFIFSSFLLKEHVSKTQVAGLLLGFTGVCLALYEGEMYATFWGALWVLGAAIAWAYGTIHIRQIRHHDPLALGLWLSVVPLVLSPLISFLFEGLAPYEILFSSRGLEGLMSALYTGYVSTLVCGSLWIFLLNRYPAPQVAPFQAFIPLSAALISVLFLDESFTIYLFSALTLVITGLYLTQNPGALKSLAPKN